MAKSKIELFALKVLRENRVAMTRVLHDARRGRARAMLYACRDGIRVFFVEEALDRMMASPRGGTLIPVQARRTRYGMFFKSMVKRGGRARG